MSDKTILKKNKSGKVLSGKRKGKARREFLRTSAMAAGVLSFTLLGFLPVVQGTTLRLRPPGALKTPSDEKDFLSSCIKCGQCVQVCPVEAIKLADMNDGIGIGTPYINARDQACDFSCDGLQCVLACPTGSLAHELDFPADSRMGFARLSSPGTCLAALGKGFKGQARGPDYKGVLRFDEIDRWNPIAVADHPYDLEICDLCIRQCPIEIRITQCAEAEKNKPAEGEKIARVAKKIGNECPPVHAIAMEEVAMPNGKLRMLPVIKQGCVGCGVCEMICPLEKPAIVIDIHKITNLT